MLPLVTEGYNSKDDWCSPIHTLPVVGPNLPIMSPNPYLLSRFTSNIPMPTLYAGDAVRKPKLSVIEVLLYNMAALLAGVAAGYDVRMSNVSPFHPTLLSDVPALKAPMDMQLPKVGEDRRFAANTYHGTGNRNRTALSSQIYAVAESSDSPRCNTDSTLDHNKQVKLTSENTADNVAGYSQLQHQHQQQSHIPQPQYNKSVTQPPTPQHYFHGQQLQQQIRKMPSTISTTTTSGLGSNFTTNTSGLLSSSLGSHTQPPTPSPRRKISTSSFTEDLEYSEQEDNLPIDKAFIGFHLGGKVGTKDSALQTIYVPPDYIRNGPSFSNDGGAYGAGAHRAGYLGSNYFPYRPEHQTTYERDCKSYPDYSYEYNHRLPNYYDYNYEPQPPPPPAPQHHQTASSAVRTPPPRVPQMGITAAGHRRTPSTISNNSNYNQGFILDYEDALNQQYEYNTTTLPLTSDYGGSIDTVGYREPVPFASSVGVPAPTKQELYKSSPKPTNRFIVGARNEISTLNRMREYENLPFNVSPLHKPLYQYKRGEGTPLHNTPQRNIYSRSRSTPMSPINTRTSPPSPAPAQGHHKKPSSIPRLMAERPDSLPFDANALVLSSGVSTKLRSSLKKYNNYKTPNGAPLNDKTSLATCVAANIAQPPANSNNNAGTANSTPTNTTPPDSYTSDDSSYLSAKEGSISSHSRVRFSPEAYMDANSPGGLNNPNSSTSTHKSLALHSRRLSRCNTADISNYSTSPSS